MPPFIMATLLLLEHLLNEGHLPQTLWVILAAEIAAYLLPILILRFLPDKEGKHAVLRFKGYRRQTVVFVLWISLAAALMAAILNYGFSILVDQTAFQSGGAVSQYGIHGWWQLLLTVVVLPAFTEELFFRGVMFSALERYGTWPALLLTSVSFALIHGDLNNFAGPLFAGMIYGYITYVLDSVWPAVFAHMVNNALVLFLANTAESYVALGLWPYIMLAAVFLLCMFTALAMRSLDGQIEKGRVRRLQYLNRKETWSAIVVSPGMWLMLILFAVRVLY